jgi:lysozyme
VWKDSLEIHDLHMNEAGLALIKKYEGLYLEAYQCGANVWTIGWGHTAGVKQGDRITKDEAESLLREDVRRFESGVKLQLKYLGLDESELNENQFSALVSLCFNCGLIPLNKDNTIGRSLVKRNYLAAADGFLLWRKAGGRVLKGLVRRRQEEKELFLS